MHSLVISMVNTSYIFPEHDTCFALYHLAGVGRPDLVQQHPLLRLWRHWSWHQLEFPSKSWWLLNSHGPWKLKLVVKHSLSVESRLGLTVPPAAAAWLLVGKARQWCCPAAVQVSWTMSCYSVCLLITVKLNSISQSDQSSWKTFSETLWWKSFR